MKDKINEQPNRNMTPEERKRHNTIVRISSAIILLACGILMMLLVYRIGNYDRVVVDAKDDTEMIRTGVEPVNYETSVSGSNIEPETTDVSIIYDETTEPVETIAPDYMNSSVIDTETTPVLQEEEPETEESTQNTFSLYGITYDIPSNDKLRYPIQDYEFHSFLKCVEAEVTGTNPDGLDYTTAYYCKLHVAQVILNRIESPHFPNDMEGVIFEDAAFSPVDDGRLDNVMISENTIQACVDALNTDTPDTVYGCEYFIADCTYCEYGDYIFTDEVNHSFFKGRE